MQRSGFTIPILIVTPVMIVFLKFACNNRKADLCNMALFLPKEVFWNCNSSNDINEIEFDLFQWHFWNLQILIWIVWLLSQTWITLHLWIPGQDRLARSEE